MMCEKLDLKKATDDRIFEKEIAPLQARIGQLQRDLWDKKIPVILIVEGWNASGITMVIQVTIRFLDPRGFSLYPIGSPSDEERERPLIWRFWVKTPSKGRFAIFARSWYGRVLVECVEEFCTENEWKRAYNEINEIESEYLQSGSGLVVKFWLELSKDEQLKRFKQREIDPNKQWKITDEDWRTREKWDLYDHAVDEMLARTSAKDAPWTIVESDDKWYARLKTLDTVIACCEKMLK